MAIIAKPGGAISPPNDPTEKAVVAASAPNDPTEKAVVNAVAPNSPTEEAVVVIALANSPTEKPVVSTVAPNSPTEESVINVAVANDPTEKAVIAASAPNDPTEQAVAGTPRILTPLVDMHFDNDAFSQNGISISFANLFTYARASIATFIDRTIVNNKPSFTLKTAAVDAARFEFDPVTGEKLGLLLEGSSTNLMLRSEEFDNAAWTKSQVTLTANDIAAPDDALTADKFAASSTATLSPGLNQSVSVVAAKKHTSSFYLKRAGVDFVQIFYDGGDVSGAPRANFNIKDVKLETVDSEITATIEDVGDGWIRIASTILAAQTVINTNLRLMKAGTDTRAQGNSFTAGEGVHIFGGQIEEQGGNTSYIKTVGAAVTRAVDILSIPFTGNIPLGNEKHTIFAKLGPISKAGALNRIIGYGTTGLSSASLFFNTNADVFYSNGNDLSLVNTAPGEFETGGKVAVTFDLTNYKIYEDGALKKTALAVNPATSGAATINIGADSVNANNLFGHLQEIAIYEEGLTAQEVALL